MDTAGTSRPPNQRRWLSFSLRTLAIVVVISAALLAIFASQIRALWTERQLPYKVIHTLDDLHEARDAQRSVIYCDVFWSIDAVVGRRTFHEFAMEWQVRMPETPVQFYLLNLSDEDDVVVREAVKVWGLSLTRGSGELL
jgi:hypothetical protein